MPKFALREPKVRIHDTTTIHPFTMKKLFALLVVALMFTASVSAQDAAPTMETSADTAMMAATVDKAAPRGVPAVSFEFFPPGDEGMEHALDGPEANRSHGQTVVVHPQHRVERQGNAGTGKTTDELVAVAGSGKYTLVPMTKTFPVYVMYFTMASDINGKMGTFRDIYSRDAKVLASFAAPRKLSDGKRKTSERVIKLDNPL